MAQVSADVSSEMFDSLKTRFIQRYAEIPLVFRAPGRVNLIGEHTDYNDGFVMPAAIDYYTWVAASPRKDRVLSVWSEQLRESIEISLDATEGPPRKHWSDYIRGMAGVLQGAGHCLRGTNLFIDGRVPLGAGLSSSAALELSVGLALAAIAEIGLPRLELVKLSQQAEHNYAGAMCGIMDQFIAGFGRAGNAILLDCRSLEYTFLPIADQVRLVLCNSMVKHDHAAGGYNARRSECAAAVRILQNSFPSIQALRDVSLPMLEAHRAEFSDVIYRRAHHVVTENERVLRAGRALQANRREELGRLMFESHNSLRDDFEVSCREVDLLVELAAKHEGLIGARMTGGGFGGCTVNLVRAGAVDSFRHDLATAYEASTGRKPDVFICSPAEGATQFGSEVAL
jgi:galactokinase